MELVSNSFQSESYLDISIQSLQDGLFFGQAYLNPAGFPTVKTYFSDGECVFKGQTILSVEDSPHLEKQKLLSAISYLSGAYTLISCWTERNFDFSICVDLNPELELFQCEKQAILKAGAVPCIFPKEFLSLDKIQKKIEKSSQTIFLSDTKISRAEIKNLLKTSNSFTKFNLHGSFFPSDLEEFREFENISAVYSVYLEGSVPCLPMVLDD